MIKWTIKTWQTSIYEKYISVWMKCYTKCFKLIQAVKKQQPVEPASFPRRHCRRTDDVEKNANKLNIFPTGFFLRLDYISACTNRMNGMYLVDIHLVILLVIL